MRDWFANWGSFGTSHEALWADGSGAHPSPASDHIGLGGCGTHDTRITFAPTPSQLAAYDAAMGWPAGTAAAFTQVALDMTPLSPAAGLEGEPFFNALLEGLQLPGALGGERGLPDLNARVPVAGGAGYVSVAMWPGEETRWSSALLLDPSVRPRNLHVRTGAAAVRVLWEREGETGGAGAAAGRLRAAGLEVDTGAGGRRFVSCARGSRASPSPSLSGQGQGGSDGRGPACEYVLMVGALGVPALLQRSGVGDPALLARLGVPVVSALPGVGRGVDHAEAPLVWALPEAWATSGPGGGLPRSGAMDWPVALFARIGPHAPGVAADTLAMAHAGIAAPPYTDRPALVVTPNVTAPDPSAGFSVEAVSGTDPAAGVRVIHERDARGRSALAAGVRAFAAAVGPLQAAGVVGPLLSPPPELLLQPPLHDPRGGVVDDPLQAWAEAAQGTAFHWLGTARAAAADDTGGADAFRRGSGSNAPPPPVLTGRFQLRDGGASAAAGAAGAGGGGCVANLRVGSAACLPFAPAANPHLTIAAFAAALAAEVVSDAAAARDGGAGASAVLPELASARATVAAAGGAVVPRRAGEEKPDLRAVAQAYRAQWEAAHAAAGE